MTDYRAPEQCLLARSAENEAGDAGQTYLRSRLRALPTRIHRIFPNAEYGWLS